MCVFSPHIRPSTQLPPDRLRHLTSPTPISPSTQLPPGRIRCLIPPSTSRCFSLFSHLGLSITLGLQEVPSPQWEEAVCHT